MCFEFLCKFCVKNPYSKNNSVKYCHIVHRSLCKATVIVVKCLSNLNLEDGSSKNLRILIFAKNGPVEEE